MIKEQHNMDAISERCSLTYVLNLNQVKFLKGSCKVVRFLVNAHFQALRVKT